MTTAGIEYRGHTASTVSGKTCQRWDSKQPHWHGWDDATMIPGEESNENFCRNPDEDSLGPWCLTTDPNVAWEYCDIKSCDIFA